jgi:mono/diheme cytochrome c family protein
VKLPRQMLIARSPAVLLLLLAAPIFADETSFEQTVQPFLQKNCALCHNSKLKTAEVDFTQFKTDADAEQGVAIWEKAVEKLRTGSMPPAGLPRPKQTDIEAVVKWMDAAVVRANDHTKPNPGQVTAHRLNRAEYNNTVHDLLGVDIRPADEFPQDDSGYGFDNIGDVLSMSPVLMERYLTAADKLVRAALYGPEKLKPVVVRHQPPSAKFPLHDKPLTTYDLTGLNMPNALHAMHWFSVEGDYTIRVALDGRRPNGSEPVEVGLWMDGKQVQTLSIDAPSDLFSIDLAGMQREVRIHVPQGEHWLAASILHIYEGLPPSYGGPNPSTRPEPPPPDPKKFAKIPPNATPDQVAEAIAKAEEKIKKNYVPANRAAVHFVEVVGPYNEKLGQSPESRKLIFVCGHEQQHNANCPRLILSHFARRSFRRPVSPAELQPYFDLYAQARQQGSDFDDAIGVALQAILVSPDFLFRIETPEPVLKAQNGNFRNVSYADPGLQPISEYALASRLSYFLWSTMPDDELMRCADRHTLRRPEVLKAQVERMLKDPRSEALADNFAGQWLELRKLEYDRPDHDKFPQFDEYLRLSMRQETEMFFEDVVHNDRSILDFLDSKKTFVNQKLAEFYGIPGVAGTEFRPVSLEGTERRGILTQASILTVSSYATRTSPVLRGKWVLENMLNSPIPPPPPDVPRFDEGKVGLSASIRMQMEDHRKNPMCASCHQKMDPIGFAFENYNAIGEWRDKDGKWPVDASGKLPDGRSFVGALELEQIYRGDPTQFAECVTEKLLTYALGRGLERYDRPTVKTIVKKIAPDDYRFSDLVLEIVNSMPFEMRSGENHSL